ncbi:MAG: TenA family transcriptional regulator [Solirubrobacterales bacterium]
MTERNEMNVWDRIEQSRERCNVLEHPFYERWSAGELTDDELARYSGQYGHAVRAIADLAGSISSGAPRRDDLRRHAAEEADHVEIWDGFTAAVGGSVDSAPTQETADCVRAWSRPGSLVDDLARMYAIESGQPEISRTKLAGLRDHYGVPAGAGTRYFELHEELDVLHADEGRRLLNEVAVAEDEDAIVDAAETAFAANWRLLDGV